jgi:hypothetical protein
MDILNIVSTRGKDDEPVCELTWGPLQWYAPVPAVRETAMDLTTCAAYADMMMTLVDDAGLPASVVANFTSAILSTKCDKPYFGTLETITLLPAGSTSRHESVVLLKRGSMKGELLAGEACTMALHWLEIAEATESDQLISEALDGTGVGQLQTDAIFRYLRELRAHGHQ